MAGQEEYLRELAGRLPFAATDRLRQEVEALQRQITSFLGDTAVAQELQAHTGAIASGINRLSADLQHLRQVLTARSSGPSRPTRHDENPRLDRGQLGAPIEVTGPTVPATINITPVTFGGGLQPEPTVTEDDAVRGSDAG